VEGVVVIDRDFWRGRRVLVTGHTGFKGSWLTLWLRALGAQVIGLSLAPVGRSLFVDADVADDCESHLVDLRDVPAVGRVVQEAQADVVFHLAAQSLVRRSYAGAVDTWMTNVMGTVHLLDALRQVDATRAIVVVTSDKCYEQGSDPHPFTESDPLGGHDPYSSSKGAAEIATASWRRSFFDAKGVGVATARAGNVIGGGDWAVDRLIPDLMGSVLENRTVRIRSPHATRPWQHVLDPLSGYLLLAERLRADPARHAGAWNFGPGADASMPVWAVADLFSEGMGGAVRWIADEGPSLHEAATLSLSTGKAQRELGWHPRLTIDEAIRLTAEAYRAAIWSPHQRGGDPRAIVLDQIRRHETATVGPSTCEAAS
jgi:CDP-glucose 4,6-dehydratase